MPDTISSIGRSEITQAIVNEREEWDVCAETINRGRCIPFAENVVDRLGGETDTLVLAGCEVDGGDPMGRWGGHVWIVAHHLGLHFDAEVPGGTPDWQSLPFYQRKKDDPAQPIGPVGDEILSNQEHVTDGDVLRYIEDWSDVNCVYQYRTDGSRRQSEYFDPNEERHIAEAKYTPTRWWEGSCPTVALMDLLREPCPDRGDWRSWLDEENQIREQKGLDTYDRWFEGGIEEPVIVDGQGPLIWDGWHRVAWSIATGKKRVPVYLGTHPGPERATVIADHEA
jgi:hypothetical protein